MSRFIDMMTFAGASGHPLAGHAPVGSAGFSLRTRGLKPTGLFSDPSAACHEWLATTWCEKYGLASLAEPLLKILDRF